MSFAKILLPVLVLLSLSACKQQQLAAISGTYEGDYSLTEDGHTDNRRVSVNIEHVVKDVNSITIAINDKDTGQEMSRLHVRKDHTFSLKRKKNFYLKGPLVLTDSEVQLKINGSCASEGTYEEGAPSLISICIRNDVISFESQNVARSTKVSLYLNKTADLEKAQTPAADQKGVTLQDLFAKVQSTNYDSREAAQKLIRAQEEMKTARSGLFPSEGVNGTLNLISYPLSAGTFFGNLVPFIFPTNWFVFNQKARLADAEVMSYRQLIADQMSIVEDLYHEILRDQHLLEILKSEQNSILRRRDILNTKTRAGIVSKIDHGTMELDDLVTQSKNDISNLQAKLNTEYAILTVGVGFSPRNGIQTLADEALPDVTTLSPLNSENLMAEAKAGSVELTKALMLEDAANADVKGAQYSYLNPADWIGWNGSIEHKIKIAKSNRKDVQTLRERTESGIEEQAVKLTEDYNNDLTQIKNLQNAVTEREKYVNLTQTMYRNGYASILELRTGIEGLIKLKGDLETATSGLAEVIGKINRLLWHGDYVQVKMMGVGPNSAPVSPPTHTNV